MCVNQVLRSNRIEDLEARSADEMQFGAAQQTYGPAYG